MKCRVHRIVMVLSCVPLAVSPASAGPPNPTASDGAANTAGGTNALLDNTTGTPTRPSATLRCALTPKAPTIQPAAAIRSSLTRRAVPTRPAASMRST